MLINCPNCSRQLDLIPSSAPTMCPMCGGIFQLKAEAPAPAPVSVPSPLPPSPVRLAEPPADQETFGELSPEAPRRRSRQRLPGGNQPLGWGIVLMIVTAGGVLIYQLVERQNQRDIAEKIEEIRRLHAQEEIKAAALTREIRETYPIRVRQAQRDAAAEIQRQFLAAGTGAALNHQYFDMASRSSSREAEFYERMNPLQIAKETAERQVLLSKACVDIALAEVKKAERALDEARFRMESTQKQMVGVTDPVERERLKLQLKRDATAVEERAQELGRR